MGPPRAQAQAAGGAPKRVLALFPTEPGDPIAVLLEQGLRDGLKAAGAGGAGAGPLTVFTEYLEVTRLPDPALQRAQLEWLRRKYDDHPPDAVVAFGTSTARVLDALGAPLFPETLAVFAALDPILFPNVALPPGADAIWVRYDVADTLGGALRLQPAARRALLVAGTSDFDRAMLAHARLEVAPYAGRVAIEEVTDLTLDDLVQRMAGLPAEAVVLFLSVNRDASGAPVPAGEGLRRVVAASGAPVYINTETSVGTGVVGGAVTSYSSLGGAAAQAVLRRLADPAAGPDRGAPAAAPKFVLDWRQLQRWGIAESRVPPGSEVRYRMPSLWDQYRGPVAGALAVGAAQAGTHRRPAGRAPPPAAGPDGAGRAPARPRGPHRGGARPGRPAARGPGGGAYRHRPGAPRRGGAGPDHDQDQPGHDARGGGG